MVLSNAKFIYTAQIIAFCTAYFRFTAHIIVVYTVSIAFTVQIVALCTASFKALLTLSWYVHALLTLS